MKVAVTKKDICEGTNEHCPVDRALMRLGFDVAVGPSEISFFGGRENMFIESVPLPQTAKTFVSAYDRASFRAEESERAALLRRLPEFEFEIELTPEIEASQAPL